jgi:phosphoenolpyruvate carboxylase
MIEFINTSRYPLNIFIEDLKEALSICSKSNSNLQKFVSKIRKMLNGAKIVGYHLMQGQSRLDAESLSDTAKNILGLLTKQSGNADINQLSKEDLGTRMIEFMLSNPSAIFEREHELNYEDLRIFRHFKLQSHVNKFNNRHIPKLVIANFTSHIDFLSGLFLLHQTQNLTIEGNKVIHSKVKMIPLLESTVHFYSFPGIIQKLLTIQFVRNYIGWYKEMVFMIACSDTPRENGPVAANSAIMTCLRNINDTFLKGIHLGKELTEERAKLGVRDSDYGIVCHDSASPEIKEFWERVYKNNKIVFEDSKKIEISTLKEGQEHR